MPINTVRCPKCGARVNHTVKPDAVLNGNESFELKCPRCKSDFSILGSNVSDRTRENVKELHDFENLMGSMDAEFEKAFMDESGDSVETALAAAEKVFGAAKRALDEISLDTASDTIDADQLLETYSIPDVKSMAMKRAEDAAHKVQQRYDLSDEAVQDITRMADRAYDRASEKLSAKVGASSSKTKAMSDNLAKGQVRQKHDTPAADGEEDSIAFKAGEAIGSLSSKLKSLGDRLAE